MSPMMPQTPHPDKWLGENAKVFHITLDGKNIYLVRDDEMRAEVIKKNPGVDIKRLGKAGIQLFREMPDYDYIGVGIIQNDGIEEWTTDFEKYELLTWMGGVALGAERERILRTANRYHGSFRAEYGWQPMVVVEDAPSEYEKETYISWIVNKDIDKPERLFEEDGA